MKLTDRGSARFEEGRIRISLLFKAGDGKVRVHWFATELGFPQWELQNNQPIRIEELCGESDNEWWLFRETLVLIERGSLESSEEKKTHVKHFVYRKAKRLSGEDKGDVLQYFNEDKGDKTKGTSFNISITFDCGLFLFLLAEIQSLIPDTQNRKTENTLKKY
ncbi:MAG: hypothetical protein PHU49_12225 [Syntrophorhabdaceae bacterium]|nr:hypothetical protein [Syntrophorhabdaceae bacterium]MDD5244774.1 hypothetical protein [Syntrophorhabdaceae bacterium]